DYDQLAASGAIMGSGGLVALDERDCMVDIARYFMAFTVEESCGKCVFCRLGARAMLGILERLCQGKGRGGDIELLETLGAQIKDGSRCALGKTAPNPALTAIRYFRDEFEAHLHGHCPAGKCPALTRHTVGEKCTGCTLCSQNCPANAIPFTPYERHAIDPSLCVRCGACHDLCPAHAVLHTPNACHHA
ncbi:MAG: 4Fe-4S binding protein, partial [Kiritimatiellaeota bacterium]|nr:4Fe-4S binding protein [Kiritimatiellota bacterium]